MVPAGLRVCWATAAWAGRVAGTRPAGPAAMVGGWPAPGATAEPVAPAVLAGQAATPPSSGPVAWAGTGGEGAPGGVGGAGGRLWGNGGMGGTGGIGDAAGGTGGSGGLVGRHGAAGAEGAAAQVTMTFSTTVDPGAPREITDISIAGGQSAPVIVDTGSCGLLATEADVMGSDLGTPTATGLTQTYGLQGTGSSHTYMYNTYAASVSFDNGAITSAPTTIGVITAETVTTSTGTTTYTWNGTAYVSPTGATQPITGVMGVGLRPGVPLTSPVSALPGVLSQGLLLDGIGNQAHPTGYLEFGANPLSSYAAIPGTVNSNLYVSVTPPGGAASSATVGASIDSGGEQGSVPSALLPTGDTTVPVNDVITVYTSDPSSGGTLLYSQTVTTPPPTPPSSSTNPYPQTNFNSGVVLFSGDGGGLMTHTGAAAPDGIPIYVSYSSQMTYFDN